MNVSCGFHTTHYICYFIFWITARHNMYKASQQTEKLMDEIRPDDSFSCVASMVTRASRQSAAAVSEARTRKHLLEL